jgi:hypothetical protein
MYVKFNEYLKTFCYQFFTTKETSYGKRAQLIPYEKVVTDTPQDGWTEIEAKRFCENYVANSEAAYLCAPVTYINVADRVQECAEEVTVRQQLNLLFFYLTGLMHYDV